MSWVIRYLINLKLNLFLLKPLCKCYTQFSFLPFLLPDLPTNNLQPLTEASYQWSSLHYSLHYQLNCLLWTWALKRQLLFTNVQKSIATVKKLPTCEDKAYNCEVTANNCAETANNCEQHFKSCRNSHLQRRNSQQLSRNCKKSKNR